MFGAKERPLPFPTKEYANLAIAQATYYGSLESSDGRFIYDCHLQLTKAQDEFLTAIEEWSNGNV